MKKCPSCNAECDRSVEVCPTCGYQFSDGGDSKRTMMGFPALGSGSEDDDSEPEADPIKQTLFGFPAQKASQADDEVVDTDAATGEQELTDQDEEEDEEEEYAQTHIIPASEFDFPDQLDDDEELRGTVAGMPLKGADQEPEYDDDRTEIVSGTAVFPGLPRPDDSDSEDDDPRAHGGTLMGMSLDDIHQTGDHEKPNRATQFAIPAVQGDEEETLVGGEAATISDEDLALDEESEEPIDDAPTQAWSPGSLGIKDKFDPDGRKKLLEKIRKSKPPQRDTSQGLPAASAEEKQKGTQRGMAPADGPDLSALRKLRPKRELKPTPVEFPDEEPESNEEQAPPTAPGSGVLRPASGRTGQDKPREKSDKASVPGSYVLGRQETDSEETKGIPIGAISPVPAQDTTAQKAGQSELGDSLSDPDFGLGETDIASGDLVEKAGFAKTLSFGSGVGTDRPAPAEPGPDRPGETARQNRGQQQDPRPFASEQPERLPDRANTPPPQFQETGQRTSGPGVYDTFDGPRTPHGRHTTDPSGERLRPQHTTGQPQPAPRQQTTRSAHSQTINQPGEPAEDPLVRRIQTLFGILAGIIALVVQGVVLLDGSPTTAGIVIVALAVTLGIAAILAAAAPLPTQTRSFALFGIAGLLCAAIVLGLIVSLPTTFVVIGLAAIVALMAGGFPYFAQHLL